jgi:hypothetical protein
MAKDKDGDDDDKKVTPIKPTKRITSRTLA